MKIWQRLTQAIGAVSILLSLWGFFWLVDGFRRELVHPVAISEAPFFRQAFFIMTAIDAVPLFNDSHGRRSLAPEASCHEGLYVAFCDIGRLHIRSGSTMDFWFSRKEYCSCLWCGRSRTWTTSFLSRAFCVPCLKRSTHKYSFEKACNSR
jgi:hypothetical protein